jgi:hypothetical protein
VTYRVYDGATSTTPLATLVLDQRPQPSGSTFGGRPFQSLGTFQITSGTVRVEVDSNASGYVGADAVRVASAS